MQNYYEQLSDEDIEAINNWHRLLPPSSTETIGRDIYFKAISGYNWAIKCAIPFKASIEVVIKRYKLDCEKVGYYGWDTLGFKGLCNLELVENIKKISENKAWKNILFSCANILETAKLLEKDKNNICLRALIPFEIYYALSSSQYEILIAERGEYKYKDINLQVYGYKSMAPHKNKIIVYWHDPRVMTFKIRPIELKNKIEKTSLQKEKKFNEQVEIIFMAGLEGVEIYLPDCVQYIEVDK